MVWTLKNCTTRPAAVGRARLRLMSAPVEVSGVAGKALVPLHRVNGRWRIHLP